MVFDFTSRIFRVIYVLGSIGFTSPTWEYYPAEAIEPGPEIDVQQPLVSNLVDGTTKKRFGTATVGKTGGTKTFIIKNIGSANLSELAISKNGIHAADFIITPQITTTLAPGAITNFKVTFKPTASGIRNASIQIKSNDENENLFNINIAGLGVAP